MIPPHYQLGSTVVVCPSRFGVVPGLIPGLAILFSSYMDTSEGPGGGADFRVQYAGHSDYDVARSGTSDEGYLRLGHVKVWGSTQGSQWQAGAPS
jgi:hypothetical protein